MSAWASTRCAMASLFRLRSKTLTCPSDSAASNRQHAKQTQDRIMVRSRARGQRTGGIHGLPQAAPGLPSYGRLQGQHLVNWRLAGRTFRSPVRFRPTPEHPTHSSSTAAVQNRLRRGRYPHQVDALAHAPEPAQPIRYSLRWRHNRDPRHRYRHWQSRPPAELAVGCRPSFPLRARVVRQNSLALTNRHRNRPSGRVRRVLRQRSVSIAPPTRLLPQETQRRKRRPSKRQDGRQQEWCLNAERYTAFPVRETAAAHSHTADARRYFESGNVGPMRSERPRDERAPVHPKTPMHRPPRQSLPTVDHRASRPRQAETRARRRARLRAPKIGATGQLRSASVVPRLAGKSPRAAMLPAQQYRVTKQRFGRNRPQSRSAAVAKRDRQRAYRP